MSNDERQKDVHIDYLELTERVRYNRSADWQVINIFLSIIVILILLIFGVQLPDDIDSKWRREV